jgi:hypothetical protein
MHEMHCVQGMAGTFWERCVAVPMRIDNLAFRMNCKPMEEVSQNGPRKEAEG